MILKYGILNILHDVWIVPNDKASGNKWRTQYVDLMQNHV